jgi:chromosome segregation and condensation protein ScpB
MGAVEETMELPVVEKTIELYPGQPAVQARIPEGMDRKSILYAALFMKGRLSLEQLANTAQVGVNEAREMMKDLSKDVPSPLEIVREGELAFELRIKEEFIPIVSSICEKADFTESELKTLALIAYYQPLKRLDLVKHRGVMGHVHANKFVTDGYVKEEKGRLSTTEKFERYFGVKQITREDLLAMTQVQE